MNSNNLPKFDTDSTAPDQNQAADLIRQKLDKIYVSEPDINTEIAEANKIKTLSKHQKFMYNLGHSGKDLATIQTEWHNYYSKLPDDDKFQVWQEFYDSQDLLMPHSHTLPDASSNKQPVKPKKRVTPKTPKVTTDIKTAIKDKVKSNSQIRAKHNLQSLLFGLGMGCLAILIFMFGFFNEVIITPFIQPARISASTPIILSSASISPTSSPEVIIPKINVQIPVNYTVTSTNENVIESDLEDGVVHFPTTAFPGQDGNAAFFGHSSNNIFNSGKYKFAFVLLHTMVDGDTFYLTYNGKIYVYKVINKYVVNPSDVSVLNPVAGQIATATLITCDPPGTSINRLIVVGQQISPDPNTNSAAQTAGEFTNSANSQLPGNGPTLWSKFIDTLSGKIVSVIVVLGLVGFIIKRLDHYFKTKWL